jgi:hypothetical protein
MKKSTTNLYNSSIYTIYILIISFYDKLKVNLFMKHLSQFMKLQERCIKFMNNVRTVMWDEQMTKQPK